MNEPKKSENKPARRDIIPLNAASEYLKCAECKKEMLRPAPGLCGMYSIPPRTSVLFGGEAFQSARPVRFKIDTGAEDKTGQLIVDGAWSLDWRL